MLGRPFGPFLYALAIALEMLLNAASVGDRFMRLERERDQAQARADTLNLVAHTDALTGLPNRRSLERQVARRRPRAVAILDIDHFKRINDTFGHDQGDAVLVAVARALAAGPAFAGRLGGEEFAPLLDDENLGRRRRGVAPDDPRPGGASPGRDRPGHGERRGRASGRHDELRRGAEGRRPRTLRRRGRRPELLRRRPQRLPGAGGATGSGRRPRRPDPPYCTSSRRRAMTWAWISAAPSKIDRMRASQSRRLTGYSRAKPLPPWIWRALSAAAQATRAASSFAMPASRSQRLPSSFWCAAK
ncbi:GGDEF domain-containing protein [Methylobacterium currus]|uniref:diguanylate cyclase n=1 Tax=Methylobacterium currus TaxID=2051553 RepID=A0A2R4WR04_9HYPH|nr:GGDEF domain-containing protein [Methylobacterium currus]